MKARLGELLMPTPSRGRLFYRVFLPLAVAANVGLALAVLMQLRPDGWLGWLEVATGGFCCAVAGWLAASPPGQSPIGEAPWRVRSWRGARLRTRSSPGWRRCRYRLRHCTGSRCRSTRRCILLSRGRFRRLAERLDRHTNADRCSASSGPARELDLAAKQ